MGVYEFEKLTQGNPWLYNLPKEIWHQCSEVYPAATDAGPFKYNTYEGIVSYLDFPSVCSFVRSCWYFATLVPTSALKRGRLSPMVGGLFAYSNRFQEECFYYDYDGLLEEYLDFTVRASITGASMLSIDPEWSAIAAGRGSLKVLALLVKVYKACASISPKARLWRFFAPDLYDQAKLGLLPGRTLLFLSENIPGIGYLDDTGFNLMDYPDYRELMRGSDTPCFSLCPELWLHPPHCFPHEVNDITSYLDYPSACSFAVSCKSFSLLFSKESRSPTLKMVYVRPNLAGHCSNRFMGECARLDYDSLMDEYWSCYTKSRYPDSYQRDPHHDCIGFCISGRAAQYGSLKVLKLFKDKYVHPNRGTCFEANIYAWAMNGNHAKKVLTWLVENNVRNMDNITFDLEKCPDSGPYHGEQKVI